jgi:hypothetical protein
LLSDREIARRIRNKVRWLTAPAYQSGYAPAQRLSILWNLLVHGILPGRPRRLFHFLRTLPLRSPASLPLRW